MSRIYVIVCFLLVFGLPSCRNMRTSHNKIYGVKVTRIFPLVLGDGSIENMIGLLNVYQYNNLIMYERAYHFDSSYNDELILKEFRYNYYIFHKDSSFGYGYEIPDRQTPARISVDSIKRFYGFGESRYEELLDVAVPHSLHDKKNNVISEMFTGGILKNDSVFFYYDRNFKNTVFSFSSVLDSLKKSKLYKIRIVNDSTKDPAYTFTIPKRESVFEMKDTVLTDDSKIRNLFNRYLNGK